MNSLESYIKTYRKSHLIFDLDETIVHLILPWEKFFDRIKEKLLEHDSTLFHTFEKGKIGINELENKYVEKYGNSVKKILSKNRNQFEYANLREIRVNENILNFIKNANDNSLFLWSNNTKSIVENVLNKHRIYGKFKKIVSYDDMFFLKPNAEGFGKIYDINILKGYYVFIGDSLGDKKTAENIGVDFYYVDYFKDSKKRYDY